MVLATNVSGGWTAFDGRVSVSLSCLGSFHAQTMTNVTGAALYRYQWLHLTQLGRRRLQVQSTAQDHNTANRLSGQELFETFLRERQPRSDFVSKASDLLWRREIFDVDKESLNDIKESPPEYQKVRDDEDGNGFLKLSQTRRWTSGMDRAPTNAKLAADEIEISREDRRRASFFEYEALKRELFLLTIFTGASCSIYCAIVLSYEACYSYGIGAMASLLYLKLLFHHAGKISEDNVAKIFLRRRRKKIGIQSADLQDSFEKSLYGSSLALSSPRLVIPASLFGVWKILHESSFSLQLAPLILGFFAYKGALLIQTFRDNKELAMTFPKEEIES